jgi:hypothetical protein
LRELIITQEFIYVVENVPAYKGVVIDIVNPEVAVIQLWPCDEEEQRFTYYFEFKELKYDIPTRTGFLFDDLPGRSNSHTAHT